MGNMSYCRFRNTLLDLQDCFDNLPNEDLSLAEARAFANLVELAKDIATIYQNTDDFKELVELALEIDE